MNRIHDLLAVIERLAQAGGSWPFGEEELPAFLLNLRVSARARMHAVRAGSVRSARRS